MGVYAGPDVVEDGLVLALDAGNTKSYPGYWSPTLSNGANAFDGSLSTAAGILGGTFGPFTYTFANPPAINSARMFVTFGAGSNQVGSRTNVFLVNGIDVTQKAKDANVFGDGVGSAWIDVTAEAGSNWNTFQFTGTGGSTNPGIYAIEINGKIIVGNYNGTTWTDLSGNGNNGTLVNGVGYNSDNGGSLTFDGVNDYITVSNVQPNTNNFTISVWVYKFNNTSNDYIWDFGANGGTLSSGTDISGYGFRYYNSTLGIGSNMYTQGTIPDINKWYNVSITRNSGTSTMYVNGSLITSSSGDTHNISSTTLYIGRYGGGGGRHHGYISNFKIYNKALTASEIQQNFNALRGRFGL